MNAFWRNTLLVFRMIQPNQRQMRFWHLAGVNLAVRHLSRRVCKSAVRQSLAQI